MEYIWGIGAAVLLLAYIYCKNKRKNRKETEEYLDKLYGKENTEKVSHEHMEHLIKSAKLSGSTLPKSVWDDFDMEAVFNKYNQSVSAIGEEYFFLTLNKPTHDKSRIISRQTLIKEFCDKKKTKELRRILFSVRKHERITIRECVEITESIPLDSTFLHCFLFTAFLLSFILMFIFPQAGILLCLTVAGINSFTYFMRKSRISCFYDGIVSVRNVILLAENIKKAYPSGEGESGKLVSQILEKSVVFRKMTKFSSLIKPESISGSITQILGDYLKFVTHADLIQFNIMVSFMRNHKDELLELYSFIGELELGIISAGIYDYKNKDMCFSDSDNFYDKPFIAGMSHPLIDESVKNSLQSEKSVLITGSNASGKSTYLRMAGINVLFSQTLGIVFASVYRAPFYELMSSMEISDDIAEGDSFYLAEIKHLKKIIDSSDTGKRCFIVVDEILRGTNTLERIAASAEVLKYLNNGNSFIIAATHDIELTEYLRDYYESYYFTENSEGEKLFDFKLYKGVLARYNAIAILERYGFPEEIIRGSRNNIDMQRGIK